MKERGLTEHSIEVIRPFMQVKNEEDMWTLLDKTMQDSETGRKGIEELRFIFDKVRGVGLRSARLELDLTLARGLNYYTGAIFEVKAHGVQIGSIGGGGRYDDLTGIFGMKNVSGVGVSFGLDRIYLALEELGLFAGNVDEGVQLIFANMGDGEALYSVKALKELRAAGIKAEIYPDAVKLGRQMDYANKKSIPYVAIAGSSEVEKGVFTLKNMNEGTQSEVRLEELLEILKK
jgi:histidyl-tRNA synthetase